MLLSWWRCYIGLNRRSLKSRIDCENLQNPFLLLPFKNYSTLILLSTDASFFFYSIIISKTFYSDFVSTLISMLSFFDMEL